MLHKLSDAQVQREIGGAAVLLHQLAPKAKIDTIAFPGGYKPRNSRLIAEGKYKGFRYKNRAGFMAFPGPAPSPVAKNQDRLHILRIVACKDVRQHGLAQSYKEGSSKAVRERPLPGNHNRAAQIRQPSSIPHG